MAFATYGSPMFGTYPAHRLLEDAPKRGLGVHVSSSVSSLDGAMQRRAVVGFEGWEAGSSVALGIEPK